VSVHHAKAVVEVSAVVAEVEVIGDTVVAVVVSAVDGSPDVSGG